MTEQQGHRPRTEAERQEDSGSPWRAVRHTAVSARVKGELLRVITEQGLKAGDRLPAERDLASLLGASRPSVREAVQILQAEGLLQVRHGVGTFIAEPEARKRMRSALTSPDDLSQLFDMREVLEVAATRWAAERQLPALAEVRTAFDALEEHIAGATIDWDEMQRLDITFHTRIVQAAGNPLLEQTQSVIYDMILAGMRTTLSVPGRLEASRSDHQSILSALEAGDAAAAADAARAHIDGAREAAASDLEGLARH